MPERNCVAFLICLTLTLTTTATADLRPVYPPSLSCGPITSLFGDRRDLDGARRDIPHEGIDLGHLGDRIIAPADGEITAIWPVDHGWGKDWNILITHRPQDLKLRDTGQAYYTEFDHLQSRDIAHLREGQPLRRGDPIGRVRHPGNAKRFRAEVHMEVYILPRPARNQLDWRTTTDGRRYWWNGAATLRNPLSLFHPTGQQGRVLIPLYKPAIPFTGFTYPLDCTRSNP